MIRKSWRTKNGKWLSLMWRQKKKVLAFKWIDWLHFHIYKDIIFKSHLSIQNQEDCGKRKPFQANFISVCDRQWDHVIKAEQWMWNLRKRVPPSAHRTGLSAWEQGCQPWPAFLPSLPSPRSLLPSHLPAGAASPWGLLASGCFWA